MVTKKKTKMSQRLHRLYYSKIKLKINLFRKSASLSLVSSTSRLDQDCWPLSIW